MRALELPLADLEQKSTQFETALATIEAERQGALDALAGDRLRLAAQIEAEAAEVRTGANTTFDGIIRDCLERELGEKAAQEAITAEIPHLFSEAARDLARSLWPQVEVVLGRHQVRVEGLIDRVRSTAADLFDLPRSEAERQEPFRVANDLTWISRPRETLNPLPKGMLDPLLPLAQRRDRLRQRLKGQARELVSRNVEALRWNLLQHLDHTFRSFTPEIEARFAQALSSTQGALQAVMAKRRARSSEMECVLPRMRAQIERLAAIRAELADYSAPPPASDVAPPGSP